MSEEQNRRRRVTYIQLEILWEYLRRNPGLATGRNKTAQAREYSRRMWMSVAQTMNAQGEGATKDWKGWSKYWSDYKAKLKSKKALIETSRRRTGGGPAEVELTEIERKFISLLGEGFGSGIPGARVEPFDIPIEDLAAASSSTGSIAGLSSPSILLLPSLDVLPPPSLPFPSAPAPALPPSPPTLLPSPPTLLPSPPALRPSPPTLQPSPPALRPSPPVLPPSPSALPPSAHRLTPTQAAPQRHRRRRNVAPMTAEAARRTLINIAEGRINVLHQIVRELQEIKEVLRARETARGEK